MLAIRSYLEDDDQDVDEVAMETGMWCKQNWKLSLYCLTVQNFYFRQHAN